MQYSGGTVAVVYNSNIVWLNTPNVSWAGIKPGALFAVQGDAVFYPVGQYRVGTGGTRDSIVLTGTYRGDTNATAAYVITNDFTPYLGLPMINRGDLETATIYDYAMAQIDSAWKAVPGDMFKAVYDPTNRGYVDHAVLADTVAWSGITGVPTTFTPAHHANTHLPGTADPIALASTSQGGLCPIIDGVTINIVSGKLTALGTAPLPHAPTHFLAGTDPIALCTTTKEGLCPPVDNVTVQISGGKLFAPKQAPLPHETTHLPGGTDVIPLSSATAAGLCPMVDGTTIQVTAGNKLAWIPQVPTHAPTHLTGGADPIALASSSANGLCPMVDGVTIQVQGGKLVSLGTTPLPHAASHLSNGSDPVALATTSVDGMCPPLDGTTINVVGGKLTATVQAGGQLTTFTGFTIPASGSTVVVSVASAQDILANGSYVLSDNVHFMNATCMSTSGTAITFKNTGAPGATSGTMGAGRVYVGASGAGVDGLMVGAVFAFTSVTPPAGALLCDGSTVTKAAYPDLFAVCGTTYGPGANDGLSFSLPDLRSKFVLGYSATSPGTGLSARAMAATGGEELHTLVTAELAAHSHGTTESPHTHGDSGHYHGMDHYHNWGAQGSHAHGLGGHTHTCGQPSALNYGYGGGATFYQAAGSNTGGPSGGSDAASTPAGNTVYASQTSGGWANTGTAYAAIQAASTGITVNSVGSGTPHQNMPPFVVLAYMIKAVKTGIPGTAAPTIDVQSTTTGAAGSAASVTNVGTVYAALLAFTVPQGIQGVQGIPGPAAHTLTTSSFVIPPVGQTVVVSVSDTSWAVLGEFVNVQNAGGSPSQTMALQISAMTPTSLTLLNPTPAGSLVSTDPNNLLTSGSDSLLYLPPSGIQPIVAPGLLSLVAARNLTASDSSKFVICSGGTWTLGLPAPAIGMNFRVRNDMGLSSPAPGIITIQPASGTIDGLASMSLLAGQEVHLFTDGTNWRGFGRQREVLIGSVTFTNVATAVMQLPDGYTEFELSFDELVAATGDVSNLQMQLSNNRGSSWLSNAYYGEYGYNASASTWGVGAYGPLAYWYMTHYIRITYPQHLAHYTLHPGNANQSPAFVGQSTTYQSTATYPAMFSIGGFWGNNLSPGANALQFNLSAGNIGRLTVMVKGRVSI